MPHFITPMLLSTFQFLGLFLMGSALWQVLMMVRAFLQRQACERQQQRRASELWRQRIVAAGPPEPARRPADADAFWRGTRKFVVKEKIEICRDVCSFYLAPLDQLPLPLFKPGQHLSFQLRIPGQAEPVSRCYSLSDSPRRDYYRITVKRHHFGNRPGLVSNYFHDHVHVGAVLDVKAPGGHFFLDVPQATPVVLIGAGSGITPLLSMVNAIATHPAPRETWLFYGVRDGQEHIMKDHLTNLARMHDHVEIRVCYSRPAQNDLPGRDYHHAQRIDIELLKHVLPGKHYEFYLCGPAAMVQTLCEELAAWGVAPDAIHYETFSAAPAPREPALPAELKTGRGIEVRFSRSGLCKTWLPESGTLLEFAESLGVPLEHSCRMGNCGTCLTKIHAGKARYLHSPNAMPPPGTCFACVTVPETDLVLDA